MLEILQTDYDKLKEKVTRESLVPFPFIVGKFVKRDINDKTRFLYPNTWVFHDDVVEKVLSGNYSEIMPFCSEFVPTMNCSNRCGMCGYRYVKMLDGSWKKNDLNNPRIHIQNANFAKGLIDKLKDGGIKGLIFTGGGEPTLFEGLEETMAYATKIGIDSVLYTNGNFVSPERIRKIIDTMPLVARVSLNAGTEEVYNKFHNPKPREGALQRALRTIEELARGAKRNPSMSVGVGIVVNEINRNDLVETAKRVREISEKVGGGIEFITYRPAFNYYGSEQLQAELLDETCEIIERDVKEVMRDTGIHVSNLKLRFAALKEDTKTYSECRGTGPFGELGPDGRAYLCCDRNLNPNYEIGDLTKESLREIWGGEKRKKLLEWINCGKCAECPPACKSHELNKHFEDVERLRRAGELCKVKLWAEMLKKLPPPKMINF